MLANFSAMLTLDMGSSGLTAMHLMDGASRLGVAGKFQRLKRLPSFARLGRARRPSPHEQSKSRQLALTAECSLSDGSRIPSFRRLGVQRAALPARRVGYSREWWCSSPLH